MTIFDSVAGPPPARGRFAGLGAWLLVSVATGLAVGLVESALTLARVQLTQNGIFHQDPHVLWMAVVSDLLILTAAGLGLGLLVRPIPRVGRPLAALLLATLASFTMLLAIPGLRAWACLLLAMGLASWVAPAARSRRERVLRLVRRATPALVLALIGVAAICYGRDWLRDQRYRPSGRAPATAPNLLLIVLDTVRADATSMGDHPSRNPTPRLAERAAQGLRFDRAIATAPWTLPSHGSLFTGRWAGELAVGSDRALDDRFPTLAGFLGRHGYDTAGFVANTTFGAASYGLDRGFAHYEDHAFAPLGLLRSSSLGWLIERRLGGLLDRIDAALGVEASHALELTFVRKDADRINRDALAWIKAPRDRPFFAFLNYFDAHDPYLLPTAAARTYQRRPYTLDERRVLRDWVGETLRDRPPEELALARAAYDECLAYLDDRVGALLDEIDRLGLGDDTVVIVTADHGEHFAEHRRDGLPMVGHRLSVYQAEVHVPLLILAPGRASAGVVVPEVVSLRDVPATALDLLGLEDDSPFPGRSLLERLAPDCDKPAAALAEFNSSTEVPPTHRYEADSAGLMRAVVAEDHTLIHDEEGRETLFDLRDDPGEARDLSALEELRPIRDRLREILGRLTARPPDPTPR